MELPVESWLQAASLRKSRRSFLEKPVEAEKIGRLADLALRFRPFPGVRVLVIPEDSRTIFRGFVGGYGKITGAPAFAVFAADSAEPRVRPAVGYIGEAFILEATALGLGTCWVSGFFRPEAVKSRVELAAGEKVFAVTPLGYTAESFSAKDRIYRGFGRSSRRKPLDGIVSGEEPAPWQKRALEAARLAPSAANRQPWRFIVGPNFLTVTAESERDSARYPQSLDCGIAMLHLELGARSAGVGGIWELLDFPGVGRFVRG